MRRDKMEYALSKYFGSKSNYISANVPFNIRNAGNSDLLVIDNNYRCIEVKIFYNVDSLYNEFCKDFLFEDERIWKTYFAFPNIEYERNSERIKLLSPNHVGILLVGSNDGIIWNIVTTQREAVINKNRRVLTVEEFRQAACIESGTRWRLQSDLIKLKDRK